MFFLDISNFIGLNVNFNLGAGFVFGNGGTISKWYIYKNFIAVKLVWELKNYNLYVLWEKHSNFP